MEAKPTPAAQLRELEAYDPHYVPARIYLNANENPFGMPAQAHEEFILAAQQAQLHRYPDPLANEVRRMLAAKLDVAPECILLGNGGDELLFDVCLAYGGPGRTVLTSPPTFSVYYTNAVLTNTAFAQIERPGTTSGEKLLNFQVDEEALIAQAQTGAYSLIILASPNNPTGECLSLDFIKRLLEASSALVLIDQAYIEFANESYDALPLLKQYKNLVILRTFSKAYSLAGLRIGYLIASKEVTHELCKVRQPYSVDTLAACAARAVLAHEDEVAKQIDILVQERLRLVKALGLEGLGLPLAPSEANFLLVRIPEAQRVWQQLYDEYGILLRNVSTLPLLEDCLRISIGTPQENDQLIQACTKLIANQGS